MGNLSLAAKRLLSIHEFFKNSLRIKLYNGRYREVNNLGNGAQANVKLCKDIANFNEKLINL